ncbi:MAG: hypothetical protein A2X64_01940 [Ignavibacteria bacterium GWF2_33_9]|nr:MAG: hypothetical protein A2X64_01940 [Ignavibacteria bacterium GWF2_33_9]
MNYNIQNIREKLQEKWEKLVKIGFNSIITILIIFVSILFLSFTNRVLITPPVNSSLEDNIEKINNQEVIQVSILNSTQIQGLANKVRTFMRMRDFDVVEVGNFKEIQNTTQIIDRVGDYASAKKVAKALGIKNPIVVTQIDSTLYVRTTVILGQDYPKLLPFN